MNLNKLFSYSRKLHRWSLLFVVILGLIQMITGLAMRYPIFFSFLNQNGVRLLHFQTATYFSIAFGIQMLTGIIMYLIPWLIKRANKPTGSIKLPN